MSISGFYEVPEYKVEDMQKRIGVTKNKIKGIKQEIVVLQNKDIGVIGIKVADKYFVIDKLESRIINLVITKNKALIDRIQKEYDGKQ